VHAASSSDGTRHSDFKRFSKTSGAANSSDQGVPTILPCRIHSATVDLASGAGGARCRMHSWLSQHWSLALLKRTNPAVRVAQCPHSPQCRCISGAPTSDAVSTHKRACPSSSRADDAGGSWSPYHSLARWLSELPSAFVGLNFTTSRLLPLKSCRSWCCCLCWAPQRWTNCR